MKKIIPSSLALLLGLTACITQAIEAQPSAQYDIVGTHMANYDFMIALNHFKGHPMGGYGILASYI